MTTFIMMGKYSSQAVQGISAARTKKGNAIIKKCRGKLVAAYAMLGKSDLLLVVQFPDVQSAMKASLRLTKAFGISFVTSPALSIEEFDKLAGSK